MAAAQQPGFLRTIFHVDMDAFFVSVEELYDPSLKGKAVVVGGQRDERGVVSAASYEARKFGVHSAMPLRTAAKQCPHAIFVDGHPERYRDCSEKVYKVLGAFSPQVEMASIDEAYLDMTGTERLHGPPLKAAHTLHQRMKADTGLNCSVGIGSSRLIAKVSSAQAKPNGILCIVPGEEAKFLAPLDVREIPGVGKVMETHLHALGIKKVGDLAQLEEAELEDRFGKWGLALAGKARGEDAGGWFDSEVGADMTPNPSATSTLSMKIPPTPLNWNPRSCVSPRWLAAACAKSQLSRPHHSTQAALQGFHHNDPRAYPPAPTQLDTEIFEQIRGLFRKNWKKGSASPPARRASIVLHQSQATQIDLLDGNRQQRWKDALTAADRLRDRFGESSVDSPQACAAASGNAPTKIQRVAGEEQEAVSTKYRNGY